MTKKFTVKDMVLCALLAAMTGILSQIGIPIGEIPINLALFSVYLAGGLLAAIKAQSACCLCVNGAWGFRCSLISVVDCPFWQVPPADIF